MRDDLAGPMAGMAMVAIALAIMLVLVVVVLFLLGAVADMMIEKCVWGWETNPDCLARIGP